MSPVILTSDALHDKVVGCVLGGAIGDGMGGPYEGLQRPILYREPEGRLKLSDDTQLTLALCEAITNAARPVPEQIAATFAEWYRSSRITGMGASTYKALRELAAGVHWALAGRKGEMAAGNGAAMRAAPLAFILDHESEDDRLLLRDICRITHHSEEAYVGALAIMAAIRSLLNGTMMPGLRWMTSVADCLPDSNVRDKLFMLCELASGTSISEAANQCGTSGYVAESVPLAIYASTGISAGEDCNDVMIGVINCGGDTDTIASMTGQILGTCLGARSLPQSRVESLQDLSIINRIATGFAETVVAMQCE